MKKLTALLVAVVLMLNMMVIMASADATKPTDITADIKWVTAYDMYANKYPVVRADAVFIPAYEYDPGLIAKTPGSGLRSIIFTDWATSGMESYFNDEFNLGDGYFGYNAVWAESGSDPYDHGRLSYKFTVEEAGTYELVIVGCGQIKPENVDNDAKDRGFTYQIDGGEMFQVNISDTLGAFQAHPYAYEYGKAELDATKITTANGVNSHYYQMTYYYGMQMYLEAGEHTLDYYHLFYSGEHLFESGNGPRLNFAGAYVQKYLDGVAWENYEYPETTAPETTEAPEETTKAPEETTKAPEVDETTKAPEVDVTEAPSTKAPETTKAPEKTGGCGSMIGFGVLFALVPAAIVLKKKRD